MNFIRRIILLLSLVLLLVSVTLLLNFTAPNPTGRRYSSNSPLTTGQGNANAIGLSGERILAEDLHLPRNDRKDQLQCICNSPSYRPGVDECRVCLAYTQSIASYRRPDFVSSNFIAESKNSQNLIYTGREVDQITDYVFAARAMNIPLWVYVRVDTNVDPEFLEVVASTRGGVVYYFTVPGYTDPADQVARIISIISLVVLVFSLVWEYLARRGNRTVTIPAGKPTPRQPRSPAPGRGINNAEGFVQRTRDRAQQTIDKEDARDDIV
jgi:hypothetical protein